MGCGDMVLIKRVWRLCSLYVRLMVAGLLFLRWASDWPRDLRVWIDSDATTDILMLDVYVYVYDYTRCVLH